MVEAVLAIGAVEETAATAGEAVLFEESDAEAGAGEAGGGRDAADAGADDYGGLWLFSGGHGGKEESDGGGEVCMVREKWERIG